MRLAGGHLRQTFDTVLCSQSLLGRGRLRNIDFVPVAPDSMRGLVARNIWPQDSTVVGSFVKKHVHANDSAGLLGLLLVTLLTVFVYFQICGAD